MTVTPSPVSAPIIRYSDSRKSSRNVGASASSKPDSESITARFAPRRFTAFWISSSVSSIERSSGRRYRTSSRFSADQPLEFRTARRGLQVVVGPLLEDGHDPVLAARGSLGDELVGEHRLARAGRTGDQHRVSARDAAPHQLVEALHSGREAMARDRVGARRGPPAGLRSSREDAVARVRDAGGVQPGDLALAAHLHHLQLAHDGVALDGLVEPDEPVGHREHRVVVLALGIFPDEEGGGLEAREREREALHEVRQLLARPCGPAASVLRTMARKESTTTMPVVTSRSPARWLPAPSPSLPRAPPARGGRSGSSRRPPWRRRRRSTAADSEAS